MMVRDLEQAANIRTEIYSGRGRFFSLEHASGRKPKIPRRRLNADSARSALGNSGNFIAVELISLLKMTLGFAHLRKFLDAGRAGSFHHLGIMPENCPETSKEFIARGQ